MHFLPFLSLLLSIPFALTLPLEERNAPACPTGISSAAASRVQASFTKSGIVPTLIPTITPKLETRVTYPAGAVDLGKQFTSVDTLPPPTFYLTAEPNAPSTATYSFFLVDPDVPGPNGPPVLGTPRLNFLHWYISGVQTCGRNNGTTVTIYESPTPVSPGEQHRYTFLVYREPAGYRAEVIPAQVRPAFDLLGYTTRGGLGTPIGGNFFNESITNGVLPT